MRKILWPVVGIAGLAVIVSGWLLYRATSAPSPSGPSVVLAIPELRDSAPSLAEAPSAPPPGAAPDNKEAAASAPPPGAAAAASDLPVVNVAPHLVHTVPETEPPPPPPVTLTDKSGRVMTRYLPRPAPPAGVAVAVSPPPPLNGAVPAAGSMLINVKGQQVKLFGIYPPETTDVCLAKDGHAQPCSVVARDAVASRLARFADVHCRAPGGQRGDTGQICLDGAGVDVAGFLVGEGLALADARESNDYAGAEGVARANRRGLWHYR